MARRRHRTLSRRGAPVRLQPQPRVRRAGRAPARRQGARAAGDGHHTRPPHPARSRHHPVHDHAVRLGRGRVCDPVAGAPRAAPAALAGAADERHLAAAARPAPGGGALVRRARPLGGPVQRPDGAGAEGLRTARSLQRRRGARTAHAAHRPHRPDRGGPLARAQRRVAARHAGVQPGRNAAPLGHRQRHALPFAGRPRRHRPAQRAGEPGRAGAPGGRVPRRRARRSRPALHGGGRRPRRRGRGPRQTRHVQPHGQRLALRRARLHRAGEDRARHRRRRQQRGAGRGGKPGPRHRAAAPAPLVRPLLPRRRGALLPR
ncbi:hypothetical protein FQZ97_862330 [compost metagenome]